MSPWERDRIWYGESAYRVSSDHTSPTLRIVFTPQDRNLHLFSSFVQDEITVRPERLQLSLGARVEHNDYTGFGFQPSARMVWTPDGRNMVWGAISSADRTPSRSDTDIRVNYAALPGPGNMPMLVSLFGIQTSKMSGLRRSRSGTGTHGPARFLSIRPFSTIVIAIWCRWNQEQRSLR